jgi:hypothetical protein
MMDLFEAQRQKAVDRYLELIELQRAERKADPKLGQMGSDGFCPRTAITQEMEKCWAEAGMPRHI